METIEIKISSELYQRLRPYQQDLPHILELGLLYLKENQKKVSDETGAVTSEQTIATLRQAGALGPDMATVISNLNLPENKNWHPLQTSGKLASEIIIQQRRELTGD